MVNLHPSADIGEGLTALVDCLVVVREGVTRAKAFVAARVLARERALVRVRALVRDEERARKISYRSPRARTPCGAPRRCGT